MTGPAEKTEPPSNVHTLLLMSLMVLAAPGKGAPGLRPEPSQLGPPIPDAYNEGLAGFGSVTIGVEVRT